MNSLITTNNVPFSYEKTIFFIIEILKYAIFTKIIIIIFLQHYEHKNIVKKSELCEKRIRILEDNLEQMKKTIHNREEKNSLDLMNNNNQLNNHIKSLENKMLKYHVEMKEIENNLNNKTSVLLLGWNNIQHHTMSHIPNYYFFNTQMDSVLGKLGNIKSNEPQQNIFIYISRFKYFPHLQNKLLLSSIWSDKTVFILNVKLGIREVYFPVFQKMDQCLIIDSEKDTKNILRLQEYCKQEGIQLIDDISNK
jgi:hypothetical protein